MSPSDCLLSDLFLQVVPNGMLGLMANNFDFEAGLASLNASLEIFFFDSTMFSYYIQSYFMSFTS